MGFGIRRSKADAIFSDFIRLRDQGICQRCHGQYEPKSQGYHCSHFWGRGNKSVRFDPENAVGMCASCHVYMGANPHDHAEFFLKRLGPEKYEALRVRKELKQKVNESEIYFAFKLEVERMKNEKKVYKDYK